MSLIPCKVLTTEKANDRLTFMTVEKPEGLTYLPGQFVRCALPVKNEPRDEADFIARPYSMASHPSEDHLSFYIAKLPGGDMSPQMYDLQVGDTVWVDDTAWGMMTDTRLEKDRTLYLMASGTGLASFLSLIKDDPWSRYKEVIVVHSVRHAQDLFLTEKFETAAVGHENRFLFVPVTTRDEKPSKMLGFNQRLPEAIESGAFEALLERQLNPETSSVMVCGNPEFVKAVKATLKARGFTAPRRGNLGTLVSETY